MSINLTSRPLALSLREAWFFVVLASCLATSLTYQSCCHWSQSISLLLVGSSRPAQLLLQQGDRSLSMPLLRCVEIMKEISVARPHRTNATAQPPELAWAGELVRGSATRRREKTLPCISPRLRLISQFHRYILLRSSRILMYNRFSKSRKLSSGKGGRVRG
jgi:hypothetical protein